ncbi:MAG: EVE domain-containing protein [Candidatus Caldarchaeum sp.]
MEKDTGLSMHCWVLVVKDHVIGDEVIPARQVAEVRVRERFWLVSKRVAAMKALKQGGLAVFYATGHEGRMFLGDGSFSEEPKPLTDELRFHVRGFPSEKLTHFIRLDHARLWDRPVPTEEVVERLSFIRKKDKWQFYFRGSLRKIPEEDFNLLKSIGSS